jgi:hypothetical protein
MARRVIAMFASLVLTAAILSAQASVLAAEIPNCCANGLCPMLHMASQGIHCDMDMSRPQTNLQPCPSPNLHYVTALIFVRVAPPALAANERAAGKLSPVSTLSVPAADLEVAAPPPRTTLA